MAFFEHRLPECFTFGARGGPMWSTEVNETVGGQRFANANWLHPLHLYDVSEAIKGEADFEQIRAFHYVVGGRRDGFRFKDWADYTADRQPAYLISGSTYQLAKAYTIGARTYLRPIFKPVSAIETFRNGAGIAPTIDYTTGRITVSGHTPGDVYTWSGEFDVPVAFLNDQCERIIVSKNPDKGFLIEWPSIQVKEFRL